MSMQMLTLRRAIAIDFDGTICTNAFPDIGEPNWDIIEAALEEQRRGAGLILWTLREGEFLNRALDACKRWGLHFDAVNDSLPDWIAAWGNNPRKVAADEYWDDRAVEIRGSTFTRLKEMRLYDVIRVVRCYNCQFSKPPADDAPDKRIRAGIGDLVLRLVADTSALLQPLQNHSPVDRRDKLYVCVNDLHGLCPPVLRCPAPSPS